MSERAFTKTTHTQTERETAIERGTINWRWVWNWLGSVSLSLFSLCVCVRIIILSATRITRLSANNEEILEISACHSIKLIPSLWYDCNGMPILSIIIFVWSFDRLFYLFSLFYPLLFAFGALYWTSSTDSEVQNPNVPHILFKLKWNAL